MVWWWTVQLQPPPAEPDPRAIIGGEEVPELGEPVVALVGSAGEVLCTGALVHPRWVLTAAHCFGDVAPVAVWWGTDLVGQGPSEVHELVSVVLDPEAAPLRHDLALVELASDASAPPAALVAVPPEPGMTLSALGFGSTDEMGGGTGVLRSVELGVLEVDEDLVHTWEGGANLCAGDSGAPLVVPGTMAMVGVASFLEPTCLGGGTAHTRVDTALDFVTAHVPVTVLPDLPAPQRPPEPGDTADTGVDTDAPDRPDAVGGGGGGCHTAPAGPWGWAWLVLWGGAARGQLRQSRRRTD
jgi:hypothetical protein